MKKFLMICAMAFAFAASAQAQYVGTPQAAAKTR